MKFPASGYGWLAGWLAGWAELAGRGRWNFNTLAATAGILHKGLRRFRTNHYYKVSAILLNTPRRPGGIFISVGGDPRRGTPVALHGRRLFHGRGFSISSFLALVSRRSEWRDRRRSNSAAGVSARQTNRLILRRSMARETA